MADPAAGLFYALFPFSGDLDGRRGRLVEVDQHRLAVDRNHAVAIRCLRIGNVITPLERLHWVLGGRNRRSCRQTLVLLLEPFDAPEPEALEDGAIGGKLGTLDREPDKLVAFGFLSRHEVPCQRDDVQPRDCADRENRSLFDIAHGFLRVCACPWPTPGRQGAPYHRRMTFLFLFLGILVILAFAASAGALLLRRRLSDIHLTLG